MSQFGAELQTNWDWRAACNFMFGGTGSGLLVAAAISTYPSTLPGLLAAAALALVGAGLLMVWFEIGRPWRFLHVFFHPQTSWMSREASVGSALFPVTVLGVYLQSVVVLCLAALLAGVFLYCQARILKAARGIPAWREPAVVPLVIGTGLAEGTAIATPALLWIYAPATTLLTSMTGILIILVCLRLWSWITYRNALSRAQTPPGALTALAKLQPVFLWAGTVVPLGLLATSLFDVAVNVLVPAASVLIVLSGWYLKFGIVVKAAYKQGYGMGKLRKGRPKPRAPVRRDGDPIQY